MISGLRGCLFTAYRSSRASRSLSGGQGERHPEQLIPVFGLPGHQAAVSICFEQFVRPVLTRFTGASARSRARRRLFVPHGQGKARQEHCVLAGTGGPRARHLEKRDDGLWARPVFGASGLISTLVKAVGTVVVPVNTIGIEAGEEVEVRLF